MSIKEKIYEMMPISIQNLMISVYGRMLYNHRYDTIYKNERLRLASRDITDSKEQKEIQNARFLDLLHYAVNNSTFYKKFYSGVDLSLIKSVDDIHILPILDKETLRINMKDVYTIDPKDGLYSNTGGTTGKSLTVLFTKKDVQLRMAYLDWFKSLYGFDQMKDKCARFNGKNIVPPNQKKKIFWRYNRCVHQMIYSSFFTSLDNIPYYIKSLNKFKPIEMDGFVSTMYDIAKYMYDNNIEPSFKPRGIFPTSETVLEHHRDMLTKVFHCPVVDQYASSEGAPFMIQLPDGHMHECIDTGVFEHIKTENGTKLIVTSFTSYGTPLIRYDIGDNIVEYELDNMPENIYGFPIIKAIDGRQADALFSEERGNISIANLSNVIKKFPNSVINVQFVQEAKDIIRIKLVVDKTRYINNQESHIIEEMRNRFGNNMHFYIEYVDEIERTKGGKYRMIINKLKR